MSEDKRPLKIAFVAGDNSGPCYHDIFVPSVYFHKYNLFQCNTIYALDYSILTPADIVVFQRQYAAESYLTLKQLKAKGKVCIFICDDNVWELPNGNPAKGTYQQADIMHRYTSIMAECHAVTTSTPHLRELCLPSNPNVYLFRNLVDTKIHDFLTPGRDNPNEIRLLWFGTPHHADDIVIVEDALAAISKKYPNVKLVFMGYHPPNLTTKFKPGSYEYYSFITVDAFYACLATLDADIGIVPLEDNGFNKAKTCRKFQEHSILEIPTVASPVGEYNKIPEGICLLAEGNRQEEWIKHLSKLIENKEYRIQIGREAFKYVYQNHNIDVFIKERAQTYYDIYAQVTNNERIQVWERPEEKIN